MTTNEIHNLTKLFDSALNLVPAEQYLTPQQTKRLNRKTRQGLSTSRLADIASRSQNREQERKIKTLSNKSSGTAEKLSRQELLEKLKAKMAEPRKKLTREVLGFENEAMGKDCRPMRKRKARSVEPKEADDDTAKANEVKSDEESNADQESSHSDAEDVRQLQLPEIRDSSNDYRRKSAAGKKGTKRRRLALSISNLEKREERLSKLGADERSAEQSKIDMTTALLKTSGLKIRDDLGALRRAQKNIQGKKVKGWKRKEQKEQTELEARAARQNERKANIAARKQKQKKGAKNSKKR